MRGKYKKISSTNCYDGKYMQIFRDEVIYPNGEKGTYEHYKKNDIVVVIPIYQKKFVLIEQYRYLADSRMIEFPMGLLNNGEDIISAGIRELKEETGLLSKDVKFLGKCMLNKGSTSQVCHFVTANIHGSGKPHYDKSESDIGVVFLTSEIIKSLIKDGKIFDGATIIGFTLSSLLSSTQG